MTSYADYLTARLATLGLSRNALARALGHRGASQVSRWCAGKAVPRARAQRAVEAAFFALGLQDTPHRYIIQTPQDAPGATISGGEAPEEGLTDAEVARVRYLAGYYKATGYTEPPLKVERYVVEGG